MVNVWVALWVRLLVDPLAVATGKRGNGEFVLSPGTGMMRYHLFGEFMSIVDILEATSKEGVCQISDACRTFCRSFL